MPVRPTRLFTVIGFLLIGFASAGQVSADWFFGIFNSIVRNVKRRQCWPEPFTSADRAPVRAANAAMEANGWRRQNMLCEYHFTPGTAQLTEAGHQKVQWILTSAPRQHRVIYVHRALTDSETSARMASVLQLASQIAPNDLPPVLTTSISDEGSAADQIDQVNRKFQATIPKPRLSDQSSSGANSSSGTSGS